MSRTLGPLALFAAVLLAPSARADIVGVGNDAPERSGEGPPASPLPPQRDPADMDTVTRKAVAALLRAGDAARAAGNFDVALEAYLEARDLGQDPTAAGRLGLIAASFGSNVIATQNLLMALNDGGGTTPKEREDFARTFAVVRARVCQLSVEGNVYDARVEIAGVSFPKDLGASFTTFVKAGRVVVRGFSETHGEVIESADCPVGKSAPIYLRWKLLEPEPALPVARLPAQVFTEPQPESRAKPAVLIEDPRYSKQENPFGYEDPESENKPNKEGLHGSVGVGPVMVFGVASWAPAVGAAIAGSLRPNAWLSIDLEGRAAWLTSGVKGKAISAMTAGGLLGLCGHWLWLFGCATGHLGVLTVDFQAEAFKPASFVLFRPGIGARVGARFDLGSSWGVQVAGDFVGLSTGTRLAVEQTVLVDQPPILAGATVAGVWKF